MPGSRLRKEEGTRSWWTDSALKRKKKGKGRLKKRELRQARVSQREKLKRWAKKKKESSIMPRRKLLHEQAHE